MKAFIPKYDTSMCKYPADVLYLMEFLNKYGTLNLSVKEVEQYYHKYSEEYWCAGWMGVDDEMCKGFAIYLTEIEI